MPATAKLLCMGLFSIFWIREPRRPCGWPAGPELGAAPSSSLTIEARATRGPPIVRDYCAFFAASASATALRISATENGLLMTSCAMALRLEARSRCAA